MKTLLVLLFVASAISLLILLSATIRTFESQPLAQYAVTGKNTRTLNILIPSSSHSPTVNTNTKVVLKQSTRTSAPSNTAKTTTIKMTPSDSTTAITTTTATTTTTTTATTTTTTTTKPTTLTKHNISDVSTTANTEYEKAKKLFYKRITKTEEDQFRSLVKVFHETLFPNVTYFLHYGTLLGSYRNHGMIPWDDDLDLIVDNSQRTMLEKRLNALGSKYVLNTKVSYSWKFTFMNSTRTRLGWNWPFLDIFFFTGNNTHIWDTHHIWKKYKFKRSIIFPLIKRPFMGMLLSAPKNGLKVLDCVNFNIDMCHSTSYNHKTEFSVGNTAKIPCKLLWEKFNFVRRERKVNTTYEILTDSEHVSVYDPVRERFAFL